MEEKLKMLQEENIYSIETEKNRTKDQSENSKTIFIVLGCVSLVFAAMMFHNYYRALQNHNLAQLEERYQNLQVHFAKSLMANAALRAQAISNQLQEAVVEPRVPKLLTILGGKMEPEPQQAKQNPPEEAGNMGIEITIGAGNEENMEEKQKQEEKPSVAEVPAKEAEKEVFFPLKPLKVPEPEKDDRENHPWKDKQNGEGPKGEEKEEIVWQPLIPFQSFPFSLPKLLNVVEDASKDIQKGLEKQETKEEQKEKLPDQPSQSLDDQKQKGKDHWEEVARDFLKRPKIEENPDQNKAELQMKEDQESKTKTKANHNKRDKAVASFLEFKDDLLNAIFGTESEKPKIAKRSVSRRSDTSSTGISDLEAAIARFRERMLESQARRRHEHVP